MLSELALHAGIMLEMLKTKSTIARMPTIFAFMLIWHTPWLDNPSNYLINFMEHLNSHLKYGFSRGGG
jgi:hypothetical protein